MIAKFSSSPGWQWGVRFGEGILAWVRSRRSFFRLVLLATVIHVFLLWALSDLSLYHSRVSNHASPMTSSYDAEVVSIPSASLAAVNRGGSSFSTLQTSADSHLPASSGGAVAPPVTKALSLEKDLSTTSAQRASTHSTTGINRSREISLFNLNVSAERVVYLIDFSGSMWHKLDTRTRYEVACDEVRKSIQALGPEMHFDIVVFADHAVTFQAQLIPADDSGKKQALDFLDHVPDQEGSTNLIAGLQAAIALQPDSVFLLTDGIANMPEWEVFQKVQEMQNSMGTRARLYAIGLVDFPDSEGGRFLKKLTQTNGGSFVPYVSWSQEVN